VKKLEPDPEDHVDVQNGKGKGKGVAKGDEDDEPLSDMEQPAGENEDDEEGLSETEKEYRREQSGFVEEYQRAFKKYAPYCFKMNMDQKYEAWNSPYYSQEDHRLPQPPGISKKYLKGEEIPPWYPPFLRYFSTFPSNVKPEATSFFYEGDSFRPSTPANSTAQGYAQKPILPFAVEKSTQYDHVYNQNYLQFDLKNRDSFDEFLRGFFTTTTSKNWKHVWEMVETLKNTFSSQKVRVPDLQKVPLTQPGIHTQEYLPTLLDPLTCEQRETIEIPVLIYNKYNVRRDIDDVRLDVEDPSREKKHPWEHGKQSLGCIWISLYWLLMDSRAVCWSVLKYASSPNTKLRKDVVLAVPDPLSPTEFLMMDIGPGVANSKIFKKQGLSKKTHRAFENVSVNLSGARNDQIDKVLIDEDIQAAETILKGDELDHFNKAYLMEIGVDPRMVDYLDNPHEYITAKAAIFPDIKIVETDLVALEHQKLKKKIH